MFAADLGPASPRYPDINAFRDGWVRHVRCVGTITVQAVGPATVGTGFLVGPNLLLTCSDVISPLPTQPGPTPAARPEQVHITFDAGAPGSSITRVTVGLADDWLAHAYCDDQDPPAGTPMSRQLHYALVRLAAPVGEERGWIELPTGRANASTARPRSGSCFPTVLQHGGLGAQAPALSQCPAQLSLDGDRLRYQVTTPDSARGAPCFDENWELIGLHLGSGHDNPAQGIHEAVPIGLITDHLAAEGIRFDAPVTGVDESPGFCVHPTLIVVCTDSESDRAQALIDQAKIPPGFAVRVGNTPPASIADNAVGVFLGSDQAVKDPAVLEAIRQLRSINIQVVPVVTEYEAFYQQTPEELHRYNAEQWQPGKAVPPALCQRVRELLGLQVAANDRSVFISYLRTESLSKVKALKTALSAASYKTFVDLDDIPLGEPVQENIDSNLSGNASQALLFIETPNAYESTWIYKELLWAYTRGTAIVVCQCDQVRNRIPFISTQPMLHIGQTAPASCVDEIVALLDQEIALANTRNVQLARTIEGLVRQQLRSSPGLVVETVRHDTSLMDLKYSRQIGPSGQHKQTKKLTVLIKNSCRRPSDVMVQQLLETLKQDNRSAAILLYDAPEIPLTDTERARFDSLAGDSMLFLIPREDAAASIPDILKEVV